MNFVNYCLRKIRTLIQPAVLNHAEEHCRGKKVKNIRHIGKSDVYCLDVPSTHNFIANGIVVHNCLDSLRYIIFSHFFGKEGARTTARELDDSYNEAMGHPQMNSPFFDPNRSF